MISLVAALTLAACIQVQEAPEKVKASIEKVRLQKSYRTTFTSKLEVPNSSPMDIVGDNVVVAGGVLFTTYKASGGETKRIVRAGDQAWVYHEMAEEWVTAEEVGMSGAGRGVQNPDDVLSVLSHHLKGAAPVGKSTVGKIACDEYRLKLTGGDIEDIVKEQAQQGSFDWKESAAEVRLHIGGDGLLLRFSVTAELASTDPGLKGEKVRHSAEVTVVDYEAAYSMTFFVEDFKTKAKTDIPFDGAMIQAIAKRPGIPAPLEAEVAKWRDARIATLIEKLADRDADMRAFTVKELEGFGKAAVPALKKIVEDKERGAIAKDLVQKLDR